MNEIFRLKGKENTSNFITNMKKSPFECKCSQYCAIIDEVTHQPDCDLIFSKNVYQLQFFSADKILMLIL